jgi:hypothetical protein
MSITSTDMWLRTIDLSDSGKSWLAEEKSTTSMAAELSAALRALPALVPARPDLERIKMDYARELDGIASMLGANDAKLGDDLQLIAGALEKWGEEVVTLPSGEQKFNCFVFIFPTDY